MRDIRRFLRQEKDSKEVNEPPSVPLQQRGVGVLSLAAERGGCTLESLRR